MYTVIGTALAVPSAVAATVLVARILGPKGFGTFGLITIIVPLAAMLTDLGLSAALAQQGARAVGSKDDAQLEILTGRKFTWGLLRLPLTLLVGYAILGSPMAWLAFALSWLLLQLTGGVSFRLTVGNQLAGPNLAKVFGSILGGAAAVLTATVTHSPAMTFGLMSLFTTLPLLSLWLFLPRPQWGGTFTLRVPFAPDTDYRFGFISFMNGYLYSVIFTRTEVIFFPNSLASSRGAYTAATTLAQRMTLLLDSLFGTLPTGLAAVGGASEASVVSALIRSLKVTQALVATTGPALLALSILAAAPLFGRAYAGLEGPVLLLSAASLAQTSVSPLLAWRYATRKSIKILPAGVIGAIVDLVLAVMLVPRLGLAGAVTANLCGSLCYILLVTVPVAVSEPGTRRAIAGIAAANILSFTLGGIVLAGRPLGAGPIALALLLTIATPVLLFRTGWLPTAEMLHVLTVAGMPRWAIRVLALTIARRGARAAFRD